MTVIQGTKSELIKVDSGKYNASVSSYKEIETDYGPAFKWFFDLESPKQNGKVIAEYDTFSVVTSPILSNSLKCKMRMLLSSLGFDMDNFDYENGQDFDLDEAIGKTCILSIIDNPENSDFSIVSEFIKD